MANPFAIGKGSRDGLSILSLEGYLDAHTAPQFEKAVEDEFEAGHIRMVVDCAKLTYISSAGLGVFMSFVEEIREAGGDIKICGLTPKVMQVFEILGFPALFDIVEDIPAAARKYEESSVRDN